MYVIVLEGNWLRQVLYWRSMLIYYSFNIIMLQALTRSWSWYYFIIRNCLHLLYFLYHL